MMQLRQYYEKIRRRGADVLVVSPDSLSALQSFWERNQLPFTGLADPGSRVARRYEQTVNLLKLGRMPALLILDGEGIIRYRHDGSSMSDIPPTPAVLELLDRLAGTGGAGQDTE